MKPHQLLFELSHSVRYDIIQLLCERPLRLTKIGEHVDANNTEVSRHLDRLKNAYLVAKNVDGSYSITSVGRLIFSMFPGISIIADYPRYFLDHDLSLLPPQFMHRLGELSNCTYTEGTINNFGISTRLIQEAKEYIYTVTKEIPQDTLNSQSQRFEGIDMRIIRQDDPCLEIEYQDCQDREMRERIRIVQELPAILIHTEKAAAVMFPNHNGIFDWVAGFSSTDPAFIAWCEDLFEYLWEQGVTLDELNL